METGKRRNWCHKMRILTSKKDKWKEKRWRRKYKIILSKTTKEIHEQQIKTPSVYLHTSKTFSFVFTAFIGGICSDTSIQLSFANSIYEPLRYFTSILHIVETQAFEDTSKEELIDGAISGMVGKLDKTVDIFRQINIKCLMECWIGLSSYQQLYRGWSRSRFSRRCCRYAKWTKGFSINGLGAWHW